MLDSFGNMVVSQGPYRRKSTVGQASLISSSTAAVTCLAAQGANNFADIGTLVLTVTPAASTAIQFTVTLSDGTNSYIFDLNTGVTASTANEGVAAEITFQPPIPATTANTAWTITASVATVVVHAVVTAFVSQNSVN
jgi:hypothetical protein